MPGSAAAFAVSLLPSCSGGLQSIRSDDLVSHWFDTTAAAFTYAGPRGRVIGVMHRLKRCILLSCPCPHVRSLPGHVLHLVFPLPRCLGSGPSSSVSALTVTSSSHASRRPDDCTPPGVSGPSGDRSDAATSANSTYVSLTSRQAFLPGYAASSSFLSSSTLHSASVSPTLSHVGVAPGLPWPSKVSPRP
jgi:hypothetical protein